MERLLQILADAGLDVSDQEVLEMLWLARFLPSDGAIPPGTQPVSAPHPEVPSSGGGAKPPAGGETSATRWDTLAVVYLPGNGQRGPKGPSGDTAVSLRVPAAPALPHSLELGRAIRPLRRHVPSRQVLVMDEQATARRVADERIWLPVMRPGRSRWLEVALVVDRSRSMAIWRQTVLELERLLQRHGAFRDVRGWELVTDAPDGAVRLQPGLLGLQDTAQGRDPRELIDARRRRLVIVVSDCVSEGWHSGKVFPLLDLWGRRGPVAIIQVLPPGMWRRTGLKYGPRVQVSSLIPGASNDRLVRTLVAHLEREDELGFLPMPVINLDRGSLQSWAGVVAGNSRLSVDGVLIRPSLADGHPEGRTEDGSNAGPPPAAAERVRRFRATASAKAWELAGLLAAVPLSLPVMRLVWQTMLPDARQVHLAEVFLGDLLQERPSLEEGLAPDEVQYEFFGGVRDLLLEALPVTTSIEVLRRVSGFIEGHFNQAFDFPAMLSSPESFDGQGLPRPFASVSARLLRRLGGAYARLADRLETRGEAPAPVTGGEDLKSNPLVRKIRKTRKYRTMYGPEILARTLSVPVEMGTKGERWQYHPRSDRHSKVACWGILFDLLHTSDAIAEHVRTGKLAFGINHEMVDFRLNRKKNLDLVLCTPGTPVPGKRYGSFRGLIERYGIKPSKKEWSLIDTLPDVPEAPVGTVRMALEAKAAMTAHVKALPRLYDELNSSHATIHGNTEVAIAVGLVMVNLSETFQSPGLDATSRHRQPNDAIRVITKARELPRRAGHSEPGFDAIGITVVACANDGSAVKVVTQPPAPEINDMDHYDQMIRRAVQIYESRYPLR